MRILVLSFYFHPDLCAGSFRATAIARELSKHLGPDHGVDVLTTMPNRYRSFRVETAVEETWDNLRIRRVPIPVHRSGMVDQPRAFAAYAWAVIRATGGKHHDLVFATSSRLMTAALGAFIARRDKVPLYLDIRDIFPDTMSDIFAGRPGRIVLPLLRGVESWTIRSAARVNVVSPGFIDYFRHIRDGIEYRTFTNGIDEEFLAAKFPTNARASGRKIILYAGNIGEGQGLDRVVPEAGGRLDRDYEFWIVGDGGARAKLEAGLLKQRVNNVRMFDPLPRAQLIELYGQADVLFLHLNDHPAFRKVLPSKIFEYAALEKPILAGVSGYARRFIEENVQNAAVFDPCDSSGLVQALGTLSLSPTPRPQFVERFQRSAIIKRMAGDVLSLVPDVG